MVVGIEIPPMKVKRDGERELQISERRVGININGRRQTMERIM
jgi:hypothetical protein